MQTVTEATAPHKPKAFYAQLEDVAGILRDVAAHLADVIADTKAGLAGVAPFRRVA